MSVPPIVPYWEQPPARQSGLDGTGCEGKHVGKRADAERDWLPLRTLGAVHPRDERRTTIVAIGPNEFTVTRRRRRRGTFFDNAYSDWRETWISQNGVDLAYLDASAYPPPKWDVSDATASWVGVCGAIEGHEVLVAKPYRVGVRRTPLIRAQVAAREFVVSRDGALREGFEMAARLPRRDEGSVNPDSDDIVWLLAMLLHSVGVMSSFDRSFGWEDLLDPVNWLDAIGNGLAAAPWS